MANGDPIANSATGAVKQAFEALGGVRRKPEIISWVKDHYPNRWQESTIGLTLYACQVNNPTAIRNHLSAPRTLYDRGGGNLELYDPARHGDFDELGYPAGQAPPSSATVEELREITNELESKNEFAYEAHLRDYLAKNLGLLESGLTLWTGANNGSTEFPIEGRRIDILAKDREGIPVVIELKLSRGHERTLGQALYYRGKLKQTLNVTRVRIIMVAAEITDELRIASSEVSDVDLFSYALTMQVQKLDFKLPTV